VIALTHRGIREREAEHVHRMSSRSHASRPVSRAPAGAGEEVPW
jgi:hypothetical protein